MGSQPLSLDPLPDCGLFKIWLCESQAVRILAQLHSYEWRASSSAARTCHPIAHATGAASHLHMHASPLITRPGSPLPPLPGRKGWEHWYRQFIHN